MSHRYWHIASEFDAQAMGAIQHGRHGQAPYQIIDQVAVIAIQGPTTKNRTEWSTSTLEVRSKVRTAMQDNAVKAMCLYIDSPGGAVAGNLDLANDVHAATQQMPVLAYASDMMASAAYETGSQADMIIANETALIGSVGTIMTIYDYSEYLAGVGIQAIPISSGGMKAAGTFGTQITEEQQAYYQGIIDRMTNQFVEAVARGRKVHASHARAWADGRVHIAADAVALGMIDGIGPLDQAIQQIRTHI